MRLAVTAASNLLEALRRLVPGASNRTLRQILGQDRVTVNGVVCSLAVRHLEPGDSVEVTPRRPAPPAYEGLHVVYEDDALLLVHKPAGLLSVATPDEREETAFAILREYLRQVHLRARLYIVHRLDRFVSGILVFAKTEKAHARLKELFEQHSIDRRYWALVEGNVRGESGTIRSRLVEDRSLKVRSTKKESEGKHAVTHYRVLRRFPGLTLLEVTLETGRRNQIRVHLAELGHPVVGDRSYGSSIDPLGRIGLHAFRLGIRHPVTGQQLLFETQPPPELRPYVNRTTAPAWVPPATPARAPRTGAPTESGGRSRRVPADGRSGSRPRLRPPPGR